MELEITSGRTIRVWWAYFWRNFVGIVLISCIATLFGLFAGFLGLDLSSPVMKFGLWMVSGIMALATTLLPIQMILGRDFGDFRLVLLAKEPSPAAFNTTASPQVTR